MTSASVAVRCTTYSDRAEVPYERGLGGVQTISASRHEREKVTAIETNSRRLSPSEDEAHVSVDFGCMLSVLQFLARAAVLGHHSILIFPCTRRFSSHSHLQILPGKAEVRLGHLPAEVTRLPTLVKEKETHGKPLRGEVIV